MAFFLLTPMRIHAYSAAHDIEHTLYAATFGELVRRWRRNHGLSQRGFGELIRPKVHAVTVSCWENDVRCPSLKHLRQIIAITGIPVHLAFDFPQTGSPEDTPS